MKTKTLLLTVALLISSTGAIEKNVDGDSLLHKSTSSQLDENGKFIKEEAANMVYNENEADEGDIKERKYKKDKQARGKKQNKEWAKGNKLMEKDLYTDMASMDDLLENRDICEAHIVCQSKCCIEPFGKKNNGRNQRGRNGDRGGRDRDGRSLQTEEDLAEEDISPEEEEPATEDNSGLYAETNKGSGGERDGSRKKRPNGGRGREDKVYNRKEQKGGGRKGAQWRKPEDWEAGDRMCMPAEYCKYYGPGGPPRAGVVVPVLIMVCMCFGVCGQRYYYNKKIQEAQDDQRVPQYAAGINESPAHGHIPVGERPGTADLQSSAKTGSRNNMA